MKIGVMGGTFDPIHTAHLVIAEEARQAMKLNRVLFIPAGRPWLKRGRSITPAEHRVAMLQLALKGHPQFELSLMEVQRPGPSYMVDTLAALRKSLGTRHRFYLILGLDSLLDLPRWKAPQRLLRQCRFLAFSRPGCESFDLRPLEQALPGITNRTSLITGISLGISSSDIRRRVRVGRSIRHLVPEAVESYIRRHKLYKPPQTARLPV